MNNEINYIQAIDLLKTVSQGEGTLNPDHPEFLASATHWLQSPGTTPLFGNKALTEKWKKALSSYETNSIATPLGSLYEISFSNVPFPPIVNSKFTFIDLFAGIGGFHLALRSVGGKCVFSSELNIASKSTYMDNYGKSPFGDIKQFTDSESFSISDLPDHNILAGGFPCQAFSQAGLQRGFEDARGTLFFEILKIAKEKRPDVLFLENVKRFKTHDNGKTFRTVIGSLRDLEYKVYAKVLRAYDYGVPQNRERIFIVAFKEPILFRFPDPPEERMYEKLGDIIEPEVSEKYTISDKMLAGHQRRLKEHREKGHGFGFSVFNEYSAYVNTISARYYKDGSEVLIEQKGKNPRKLTPRECARLQGFPEEFIVNKSDSQAYMQFGNSVAVPVVSAIANSIIKALKNKTEALHLFDPYYPIIE